jgi:hypothetical protein
MHYIQGADYYDDDEDQKGEDRESEQKGKEDKGNNLN